MRNSRKWLVLIMLVTALFALGVPRAIASEESEVEQTPLTSPEEVTPFYSLSYQLLHVDGEALGMEDFWAGLLIGSLPAETALPVRIEIGVPEGTLVGWFGQLPDREIFDGAIQFPEPYQIRTENGIDVYSAVMTSYHHMQLEFRYEGNPLNESVEGAISMNLSYTPIQAVEELMMTAAFPAGFVATDDDLTFRGAGPNDEQTYARTFEDVSTRQTITTTIDGFYVGEGAAEPAANATTIIIIVAISVALVAGIFFFFARGKRSSD
ncbi:MAG: hypothetical protein FWE48_06715 [Coriobacteriia bacterium]|nr:hypothetical protein [Coriobacteriia bacterium]MCL2870100.1 hypothetical protein [Coriobacteriia bacterium]